LHLFLTRALSGMWHGLPHMRTPPSGGRRRAAPGLDRGRRTQRMGQEGGKASVGREIVATVQLAAPLALASLSPGTMSLVDPAFVGRLGAAALGGVALGTSLYFAVAILLMGTVSAVGPIVAQRYGAKNHVGVQRAHEAGWWVALLAGALGTAGLLTLA